MNNTSMFTADRMTHLKIVVVSLVCATLVAVGRSDLAHRGCRQWAPGCDRDQGWRADDGVE